MYQSSFKELFNSFLHKFFEAFTIVQFQHISEQDALPSKTVLYEKTTTRSMHQLQVTDQAYICCGITSGMRHLIYNRLEEAMNV